MQLNRLTCCVTQHLGRYSRCSLNEQTTVPFEINAPELICSVLLFNQFRNLKEFLEMLLSEGLGEK